MTPQRPTPGGWYYHPYELAISGFSGSGKTTLSEKLIPRLVESGRSVGFLKTDAHRFEFDKEGKDTWRARKAGASTVMIEDPRHLGLVADHGPRGTDEAAIELAWHSLDLLLVEGKKRSPLPKLLMLDPRSEIDEAIEAEPFVEVRGILFPAGEESRARALAPLAPEATILCRDDLTSILSLIEGEYARRVPPLKGVVLVGGHSTRMGRDKASIRYRDGKSQARRSVELLSGVCEEVFLAAREGQELPADCVGTPRINDRFVGFGPLGGVLTALSDDPSAAWFVLSCDLPLLEREDLKQLESERDPFRLATAFGSQDLPVSAELLPEPLVAIYEPKSRTRLLGGLIRGVHSPRWLLRLGGAKLVTPTREEALVNVNSREAYWRTVAGTTAD